MSHTAVLIPGDGIGPEVTHAAKRVIAASGADITWVERHAGWQVGVGNKSDILGSR